MDNKNFNYAKNLSTSIFSEESSGSNPYIARSSRIMGFDVLELANKKSFADVLFLLFIGELPDTEKSTVLNQLMVSLINLGPRDEATRAAMVAGIGKANHEHILPIGLNVLGGEKSGSKVVENCVNLIRAEHKNSAKSFLSKLGISDSVENIQNQVPGLGTYYGGQYILIQQLAEQLLDTSSALDSLKWLLSISSELNRPDIGILPTGLAASVLRDLGFGAREAGGVYQIMRAPGILAHGLEQTHKPITAMPLLEDEKYELKND